MVGVVGDKLQNIKQILESNRFQDESNYENFLNPEIVAALVANDKERIK